jgi:hypothetical protein
MAILPGIWEGYWNLGSLAYLLIVLVLRNEAKAEGIEAALFLATTGLALVGYFYAQKNSKNKMETRFVDRERLRIDELVELFCEQEVVYRLFCKFVVA